MIDDVAWLEGTWHETKENESYEESWELKPADSGNYWVGKGIWKAQDSVIFTEYVHLFEKDSMLIYKVMDSNEAKHTGVLFKSTVVNDSILVFENPNHDFPTKIAYKRLKNKTLHIEVSNENEKMEFNLTQE